MESLKPCQFRQVDTHGRILCGLVKGGDREVSESLCRACPVQAINCQNLRAGLEKKVSTPITVRFATGRVEVWNDAPTSMDFKQAACAAKTMPIHSPRDCTGCPLRVPNVIPQNTIPTVARPQPNAPAANPAAVRATRAAASPRAKRAAQTAQPAQNIAPQTAAPIAQAAPAPSQNIAVRAPQPIAQAAPAPVQNATAPAEGLSQAAADMLARAKATAQKKAQEQAAIAQAAQRVAAEERTAYAPPTESKSKIIQIQQWLSGQVTRKQLNQPLPVTPDADGVSEIVYAPLGAQAAQVYQETIDYERCAGWTD